MICSANQMTVSMWNKTLGWYGLSKSESFMRVIIKVNPLQIGPLQGSQKLRIGRGFKKANVGVREMKLRTFWKRLKNTLNWTQVQSNFTASTVVIRNF